MSKLQIPVIDLFAGPGGLGEGFESSGHFRVALSVECDPCAYRTLILRSFFRQFEKDQAPDDYYEYLRGEISREDLFARHQKQADAAAKIAKLEKLGDTPSGTIDAMVESALGRFADAGNWILIGGPPCQAYSLVGRSRRAREDRAQFEADKRHYLYKEYLRILVKHQPAVFVMENVKGILSAKLGGQPIFGKICDDLASAGYELHSLSGQAVRDKTGNWKPSSFVVCSELHGIPQARHRVFIVGIRCGLGSALKPLSRSRVQMTVQDAIGDLPRLKSSLSKRASSFSDCWERARDKGLALAKRATKDCRKGHAIKFISRSSKKNVRAKLPKPVNHEARSHIPEDISRYAFVAEFAMRNGRSPTLADFPKVLLPKHRNASLPKGEVPFADRFRVQMADKPSSTITSHISKDGHYYIHPDPLQARSLTVREAARLQTFPDNYFFDGPRTEQYRQVGNAVPPRLALRIADQISKLIIRGRK